MLTFSAIALTIPDRLELMPLDCNQYQNLSQCSTESTFEMKPQVGTKEPALGMGRRVPYTIIIK